MREKERHNGHQDRRRGGRDLNLMQPGVVHNIRVNPNGSVSVRSSSVSFEGYMGGGPSEKIGEANLLVKLGLVKPEE